VIGPALGDALEVISELLAFGRRPEALRARAAVLEQRGRELLLKSARTKGVKRSRRMARRARYYIDRAEVLRFRADAKDPPRPR
jgi:hypothetical protein